MVQSWSTPACEQGEHKEPWQSSDHRGHLGGPAPRQRCFLHLRGLAKRCFGEQPFCKRTPGCKVHVQGGSDPTARGTFIASMCDDRFYKQIRLLPLDSHVAEALGAPFKFSSSIVGSDF